MNRGSTVLHRKCFLVNRDSTGVLLSRGPGLYRGNVGKVRTQFIFLKKCVPVHHGIPAVLHRDVPWLHRHSENGDIHQQQRFSTHFDLNGNYQNWFLKTGGSVVK